ncbi:LOW QUALITY PROTEIN: glutaminyl-peptide cyclotransferase-like protein [Aquarana catesbeiana]|uniref:LOW QUALITY PROTEIN: glutaminyl-peptide cyclotransferase-like protein n=1 Tax=Aquarana catesbeiana TaxID=8400 RepID=UPI003CC922E0
MAPRRAARNPRTPGGAPRSRIPGLLILGAGVLIGAVILFWENPKVTGAKEEEPRGRQFQIQPSSLSSNQIGQLVSEIDVKRLWSSFIRPMLIERSPGSPGNRRVRELISGHLRSLSAGWTVDLDEFDAVTPRGKLSFGNIVATLNPSAPHRLVFACHLDSKWFLPDRRGRAFVGATDSAVPCALILEAITALNHRLQEHKKKGSPLTLQLFFLDGEEAFGEWSESDSLYGARHLAGRLEKEPIQGGGGTQLDAIDLFVLLDLLGAPNPLIVNHFEETRNHFMRLHSLEKRLHRLNLLQSHPVENSYFRPEWYYGSVEDDHIPFLRKGVPVLHVISTPFPEVWHTHDDTEEKLHRPTVANLCRIFVAFLSETLAL